MAPVEFRARIQQAPSGPVIPVRIIVSEEDAKLPREQAERHLDALLSQIQTTQGFIIYGFQTVASYETPPPKEALFGHNTLVEVRLPYTLHLPSDIPFEMTCPQTGRATVVLRKIWTDLAAGSNDAEIYADDRLLYYSSAKPRTPSIPQAAELGPWPRFTGTNVEIAKDTQGIFRYTQIQIFFDSVLVGIEGPDTDDAAGSARSRAFDEARKTGRDVTNYLVDIYRYVTGAEHVERLPTITADRVYFAEYNLLSEGARIESGLGPAIVNRSGREIQRIRELLRNGTEPPRHVLLIQSSRAALNRGQHILAVVVAFQALEIVLEATLREGYLKRGSSDDDITERLKKYYKTKDRLIVLCRELTGKSVADDTVFWNLWLRDCNGKRNGVVHRNETATDHEALRVVELCEQCITRLLALPFPA